MLKTGFFKTATDLNENKAAKNYRNFCTDKLNVSLMSLLVFNVCTNKELTDRILDYALF